MHGLSDKIRSFSIQRLAILIFLTFLSCQKSGDSAIISEGNGKEQATSQPQRGQLIVVTRQSGEQVRLHEEDGRLFRIAPDLNLRWQWRLNKKKDTHLLSGYINNKKEKTIAKLDLAFCTYNSKGFLIKRHPFTVENIIKGQVITFDFPFTVGDDSVAVELQ